VTVDNLGRALGIYRRTASSRSALVLLAANLIPLVGVLFFGWSLITILVLYWIENGIVGFWNVPKIALARDSMLSRLLESPDAAASRSTGTPSALRVLSVLPSLGLALFFLAHYGIFWVVHGVFVFLLPSFGTAGVGTGTTQCPSSPGVLPSGTPGGFPGVDACATGAFGEILWGSIAVAAVALFISHGASFLLNYIGRAEYLTAMPGGQMMAPYARVVVLHITIILGSFVIAMVGAPIGALLILVGLKTAFDLGLHLREHRTLAPPTPRPPGVAGPA
jgi:hypothetical protein